MKIGNNKRFPPWLKRRLPAGHDVDAISSIQSMLEELKLSTVCNGAHCPNRSECYAGGTATFLILGDTCTRNCRFCAIPSTPPAPPREDEPQAVAEASARMNLKYVVITSVTRDDLPDGGAGHFAKTIQAVQEKLPEAKVEVLVPDFQGNTEAIDIVLAASPAVFNHNIETVPRLYDQVRPQANFQQSLDVLAYAKKRAIERALKIYTKSGLMVGLGETDDEVFNVMEDLRSAGCDILTIGQYLAPSDAHLPVERFVEPEKFQAWGEQAKKMGFKAAACGPFVRSSYHAGELFMTGEK